MRTTSSSDSNVQEDARRVMNVLARRMGRFGLTLHPDKTRLLPFGRPPKTQSGGKGPSTFDFLGLTLYWGLTRQRRWQMWCKTRTARLRRAIHRRRLVSTLSTSADQDAARRAHEAACGSLQLLRRQRQLPQSDVARRRGEAVLVPMVRPSASAQTQAPLTWLRFGEILKRLPLPRPRIKVQIWGM